MARTKARTSSNLSKDEPFRSFMDCISRLSVIGASEDASDNRSSSLEQLLKS
jgi:hypothetical protein